MGDSKKSRRSSENDPSFVRAEDCRDRHAKIELALWGPDGRGGIVSDIHEIKTMVKHRWTTKDKVAIIVALISAATAVVVALLK